MFIGTRGVRRGCFLGGCALLALNGSGGASTAQTQLPEVVVSAPKEKPKPKPAQARRAAPAPASAAAAPVTPAAQLNAKADAFDQGAAISTPPSARRPTR